MGRIRTTLEVEKLHALADNEGSATRKGLSVFERRGLLRFVLQEPTPKDEGQWESVDRGVVEALMQASSAAQPNPMEALGAYSAADKCFASEDCAKCERDFVGEPCESFNQDEPAAANSGALLHFGTKELRDRRATTPTRHRDQEKQLGKKPLDSRKSVRVQQASRKTRVMKAAAGISRHLQSFRRCILNSAPPVCNPRRGQQHRSKGLRTRRPLI